MSGRQKPGNRDKPLVTGRLMLDVLLCWFSYSGYAGPVAVGGMSEREMVGVFAILRCGGRWGRDGLKYHG